MQATMPAGGPQGQQRRPGQQDQQQQPSAGQSAA
jgi:hypothetical protein